MAGTGGPRRRPRRLAGLGLLMAAGALGAVLSAPGLAMPARAHGPGLTVSTAVRDAEGMPRTGFYARAGDVLSIQAQVVPAGSDPAAVTVTLPDGSSVPAGCASRSGAVQCAVPYPVTQADVDRGWAEILVDARVATPDGPARTDRTRVVVHGGGVAALAVGEVTATPTGAVVELTNTGDLTLTDPALTVHTWAEPVPATSCSTGAVPPGGTTTCAIGPAASGELAGSVSAVAIAPDGTAVRSDPAAVATATSPTGPRVETGGTLVTRPLPTQPVLWAAVLAGASAVFLVLGRRRGT